MQLGHHYRAPAAPTTALAEGETADGTQYYLGEAVNAGLDTSYSKDDQVGKDDDALPKTRCIPCAPPAQRETIQAPKDACNSEVSER